MSTSWPGKTLIAVDVFCGAGGLTRGLLDAGIKVVKGIDANPRLKGTYELNNPPAKFVQADVHNLQASELMMDVSRKGCKLVLAACAPCQPFSPKLTKRDLRKKKRARKLLLKFGELVKQIRPDFVLAENVPGIKGRRGQGVLDEFRAQLDSAGYSISESVLDAGEYGVPQERRRLIILAGLEAAPKMPEPKCGPKANQPFVTVRDAIGRYPLVLAGASDPAYHNHRCRHLSVENLARIRAVPHDGGSRSSIPERLLLPCHRGFSSHSDVYGRLAWNRRAPTLTSNCIVVSCGRFAHPEQDRGLTVREAAALQTFRDDYVFPDAINPTARWIGNAVPVKLGEALGNSIISAANSSPASSDNLPSKSWPHVREAP